MRGGATSRPEPRPAPVTRRPRGRGEEPEPSSEEESVVELDASMQELMQHAQSLKDKQKETAELNKVKKEDKETLISALRESCQEQMTVGPFVIKLAKKPATSVTVNQLKKIDGIPANVLAKIINAMGANQTDVLRVTMKKSKKKNAGKKTEEAAEEDGDREAEEAEEMDQVAS